MKIIVDIPDIRDAVMCGACPFLYRLTADWECGLNGGDIEADPVSGNAQRREDCRRGEIHIPALTADGVEVYVSHETGGRFVVDPAGSYYWRSTEPGGPAANGAGFRPYPESVVLECNKLGSEEPTLRRYRRLL